MMTAFLEGYDLIIVFAIVALLFGSSQLPKLARSLGSASREFHKGHEEGLIEPAPPAPSDDPSSDNCRSSAAPSAETAATTS